MSGKTEQTNIARLFGYLNECEKPVKIRNDLLELRSAYLQIYFSIQPQYKVKQIIYHSLQINFMHSVEDKITR